MKKSSHAIFLFIALILFFYKSTNVEHLQFRFIHSLLTVGHKLIPDQRRPNLSPEYRAFEKLLDLAPVVTVDPTIDSLEMAKKMRASFVFDSIFPRPQTCQVKRQNYEYEGKKVESYWVDYRQTANVWHSDQILLYFHGGGYLVGDFQAYSGFECTLSRYLNMTIIHLEYRRVPEYPLPAAVDDALILYQSLLHLNISPSQLTIMGDSAGGGLTFLTIQALVNRQLPIPRAAITLSPWVDLSLSSASYTRNRLTDIVLRLDYISWLIEQILGPKHAQIARNDSSYSPLFGSLKNFPPLFITVGTAELFEDEARSIVDKAQHVGVDVTFHAGEHLMHVYPVFFPYFPEAAHTMQAIRHWINQKYQM